MKPMLAKKHPAGEVPQGNYLYEIKYDGVRAIIEYDGAQAVIFSRNGRDISHQFPEIVGSAPDVLRGPGVYDGELVVCDENGRPDFTRITSRFHLKDPQESDVDQNPVTAVMFDAIEIDGEDLTHLPLLERRSALFSSMSETMAEGVWEISTAHDDGERLYSYAERNGLEGIVAKNVDSIYRPGGRTADWLKVKILHRETVMVVGFTEGKGKRRGVFGSLVIRDMRGHMIGNVGTGFTDAQLAQYMDHFEAIGYRLSGDGKYFELKTPLPADVKGMKKNASGAIREPVFVKFQNRL